MSQYAEKLWSLHDQSERGSFGSLQVRRTGGCRRGGSTGRCTAGAAQYEVRLLLFAFSFMLCCLRVFLCCMSCFLQKIVLTRPASIEARFRAVHVAELLDS